MNKLDKIAVQLYTLRSEMERDFEGTLKKISEIGYRQVELCGYFGIKPEEIKNLLNTYKLEAVANHVPYSELKKNPHKLCKETAELQIKHMVISWVDPADRATKMHYGKLASLFNKAGKACRRVGVQFVYHNHDFEFKGKPGETPYDYLLQETDTALVKLELDFYWIVKAKMNPIQYMNKYSGRFTHFHVKDIYKSGEMADAGKGTINFPQLIRAAAEQGGKYFIVEHDNPKDAFKSIKESYEYLIGLEY